MRGRGPTRSTARRGGVPALVLAAALAAACQSSDVQGGLDLERMVRQDRLDPYEASDFFADGAAMRVPPEGTVPHGPEPPDPAVRTGRRDGEWVERSPVPWTRDLMRRGRERFGVYCAPCHGFDGLASTPVAAAMQLQPPPALVSDAVAAHPDGALFAVVSEGWGLMPGYRAQLGPWDRWAVVAWVRALQLSGRVRLESLPPALRDAVLERMSERGLTAPPGGEGRP